MKGKTENVDLQSKESSAKYRIEKVTRGKVAHPENRDGRLRIKGTGREGLAKPYKSNNTRIPRKRRLVRRREKQESQKEASASARRTHLKGGLSRTSRPRGHRGDKS